MASPPPSFWISIYKEHPALSFMGFLVTLCVVTVSFFGLTFPSSQDYEIKSTAMILKARAVCPRLDKVPSADLYKLNKVIQSDLKPFAEYVVRPWVVGGIIMVIICAAVLLMLDHKHRLLKKSISEKSILRALMDKAQSKQMILESASLMAKDKAPPDITEEPPLKWKDLN